MSSHASESAAIAELHSVRAADAFQKAHSARDGSRCISTTLRCIAGFD